MLGAGYHYRGRHGYLYEACNDPPTCNAPNPAPPGAQLLYAVCNTSSDCANALASELTEARTPTLVRFTLHAKPVIGTLKNHPQQAKLVG